MYTINAGKEYFLDLIPFEKLKKTCDFLVIPISDISDNSIKTAKNKIYQRAIDFGYHVSIIDDGKNLRIMRKK